MENLCREPKARSVEQGMAKIWKVKQEKTLEYWAWKAHNNLTDYYINCCLSAWQIGSCDDKIDNR